MVLRVLPPLFEVVEFHEFDVHGGRVGSRLFRIGHSGKHGSLNDPMPTFPLDSAEAATTIVMRLEAINALQASVVLEPRDHSLSELNRQNMLMGAFLGLLVALLIYNSAIYSALRHPFLVHYMGAMVSVGLFSAALHGYLDLWFPGSPFRFARHIGFLNYLLLISITVFTRAFLMTQQLAPRWDRYHRVIIGICVTGAFVALTPLDASLSEWIGPGLDVLSAVQGVLLLVTGVQVGMQGFTPARYFVVGWAISLAGYAVAFGGVLGYLPMTFFTRFSVQICSALEMLVFAVGVGARIDGIRRDGLRAAQVASQSGRWKRLVEVAFHDISSPLSVILMNAKHARSSDASDLRLESIRKAAGQQFEILQFLRQEHLRSFGEDSVGASWIAEVGQVMAELRFLFSESAEEKGIALKLPSDEEVQGLFVKAHALTLANSILGNLVRNAIKFTPKGKSVEVRVRRVATGRIAFTVQDEGVGIAASDLALLESGAVGGRVSRRGMNQEEGSGLGLGIVRAFVASLGGEMKLESRTRDGSGTRVTIFLAEADSGAGVDFDRSET